MCVCCVYKVKELVSRISTLEMDKRTLTENVDEKIGQYQKVSTVCVCNSGTLLYQTPD